jgi:hypothetical protein
VTKALKPPASERDEDGNKIKAPKDRDPNRHKGFEDPKRTYLDAGGDVLDEAMGAM